MSDIQYAVVDDYGDAPYSAPLAFVAATLDECEEWAESENYHSASIVMVHVDGRRELV